MKKKTLAAILLISSFAVTTSAEIIDTTKVEDLHEVIVMGIRAKKEAPFAVANISKPQIETFSKTGQELPFMFSRTPGILAWSENGLGTGTSYMRIRGAGDSRINVTIDGVPLNSPEDQCVFWANMNSYASLLGSVQIQRGVGTSTNGDGAFGGTVSLKTKTPSYKPYLELSGSYGSYNTYNFGGQFSTGLTGIKIPKGSLVLEGAYHQTATDGYIHGTSGRSGSYYGGLSYISNNGNFTIRYKNIGNFEKTGQAWNGVTAGNNDYSMNVYDGIKTYKDMYDAGLGKYNSLYENFEPDWAGGWTTSRYQLSDGSLWNKTTDNFWQNHNILSMAWKINEYWSTTASLHYTHGYGYYSEFRYNNKLKKFGLANILDADGKTVKKSDFVRKKGLTQDTYGMLWNVNYKRGHRDIVGGISAQKFDGNHFGYLTYVGNETLRNKILSDGDYKYYDSDADKSDISAFLKATYHLNRMFDVFSDLQYRHVGYKTNGINDKFYANEDGTYTNQRLDIDKNYNFFNPKVGFSFHNDGHNAYISAALSHREPERNNFTDNGSYPAPKAESVNDIEGGYSYQGSNWYAGANLYYMGYRNQFVQTGMVSDIGENLTTNIKNSYRMGIEISAGWSPLNWFTIEGNAALSQNKIKNFDEYVETYDDDWKDMDPTVIHYDNSTLAFSPTAILNGFIDFHYKGFQGVWHTNFVSRQYLDNTANKDRSLPSYSVTDINLRYTFDLKDKHIGIKNLVLGANFGNIFNKRYAASGWVYSAIVGDTNPNDNRYYQIGYIPMAGFTAMGNVSILF